MVQQDRLVEEEILERSIKQRAATFLAGSSLYKKIKDLDAREIDCEAYTMEDHFALIRLVPELQKVLDEVNYEN